MGGTKRSISWKFVIWNRWNAGRTIGKITTNSEKGSGGENAGPEFAAVGTNTLNELTVLRATKGLFDFIKQWMASEGIYEQPRLVVAHDVRHFSEKVF